MKGFRVSSLNFFFVFILKTRTRVSRHTVVTRGEGGKGGREDGGRGRWEKSEQDGRRGDRDGRLGNRDGSRCLKA